MMLGAGGLVTASYFGYEFMVIFDELHKNTDDYYAL
jgi:hypothetical protein